MLNVNRMRMLREVAERGGIAAAAETLYMSPSAVSQQMAVLEREAGTPLLERHGRGVRLTAAGESLVAHTDRVLTVLEEAQSDLADISASVAGNLNLCSFPTAARALLIPALALLRQRHPRLRLHMSDLEPEESIPLLKRGEMDIILSYGYDRLPEKEDPSIERLLIMTEPHNIALPVDHPEAEHGGPVRMADLADEQWVVGRDGSPFMDVMLRIANEAGFTARVDLHSNDYQVILAAVEAGLGVALIPPLARFSTYPGVVFRDCADVVINRQIVTVIRKGSSRAPAIAAGLQAIREVAYQRTS
ncbi:MAG: LysR family transcriptional regulator [Anaerosomatales bacterium]